jgi:hypothetical protein
MRGDESFAYDLVVRYGAVNSRVVLLLRSIEAKPRSPRFVPRELPIGSQFRLLSALAAEGEAIEEG